jgi:hypothetical protein
MIKDPHIQGLLGMKPTRRGREQFQKFCNYVYLKGILLKLITTRIHDIMV